MKRKSRGANLTRLVVTHAGQKKDVAAEKARALQAFAEMTTAPDASQVADPDGAARRLGMRPLKPPPGRALERTDTAGARAARRDRRLLGEIEFKLGSYE